MPCLKEDHRWWHSARRACFTSSLKKKNGREPGGSYCSGRFFLAQTLVVGTELAYFSRDERIGRNLAFTKCYRAGTK